MKEELCKAFCSELQVREVPAGLAVGTGFQGITGDQIGFYIVGPDTRNMWRVQDDGATIPFIEAAGGDLEIEARSDVFDSLLEEYDTTYDPDTGELSSLPVSKNDLPQTAIQFVALLLRIQDILFMTRERAESTWVQEATRDLQSSLGNRGTIEENAAVMPSVAEYAADIVVRTTGRSPVALFFGINDAKAYEALMFHFMVNYKLKLNVPVVLLLEKDNSLTRKARTRVDNNIIVPRYRGGEHEAIGRIVETATGERLDTVH